MSGLRGPGEILLVSLYELGHQPMGIAAPLGFLRAAGFQPSVLDLFAQPFDADLVARARLIAVSVPMHTALRLCVRFLRRAREASPGAIICAHGLYASLNHELLLGRGADAIIGGESEATLLAFCQALDERAVVKAAALPAIEGVRTRTRAARPVLARQPFVAPARAGLLPLSRYARFDPGGGAPLRSAGHVEASRGCRHLCRHCPLPPVYGGRFFVVPREIVLADIAQQVEAGAEHITFGDPDFLNGPRHSMEISRAMHAAFPRLTFDITVKIEHILRHRALLPELRSLGCRFAVSAVESLSDRVLAILGKGHTREDVITALSLLGDAGIALRPSLLPFTPWSTRADYLDLLDFVEEQELVDNVDPVQLTIRLLLPPGSHLLDHPEMAAHLGPLSEDQISHSWRHPDPFMDELQVRATEVVEEGLAMGEPTREILARLRILAGADAARARASRKRVPQRPSIVPRLSEPWFC